MDRHARQDKLPPLRRYRSLPLLLLALACLGGSIYVFVLMRNAETYKIEQNFRKAAQSRLLIQYREVQRHYAKLTSLTRLYAAAEKITREEFKVFVETFEPGLTSVQALQWVPRVAENERAGYEAAAREDGLHDFRITELNADGKLVAAGVRDEYFPVFYTEPYSGNEAALGYDLASETTRRDALYQARDSGQPTATSKIILVQGQEDLPGIILLYPVYHKGVAVDTVAQRRQHLGGYFTWVNIYGTLAKQLFSLVEPLDIDHYIFFSSSQQAIRQVHFHAAKSRTQPAEPIGTLEQLQVDLFEELDFKIGGVNMTLLAKPAPDFFDTRRSIRPWFELAAGLALSLMIMTFLAVQAKRLKLVRKFAEEQAIANEKLVEVNREMEAFAYTVSHDLRAPLTPILGYAEFLQATYGEQLDERAVDCLEEIQGQGHKMMALMEDLLVLANVGHLERPAEPTDLQEVVRQVQKDLASDFAASGHELQIGALPKLRVPQTLLTQIFANLIGNAVRYAGEAGGPIEVGGERAGDRVRFFVRDHGPGVPEGEQSCIFDVFRRGSIGKSVAGTGIGLATVNKIVKLYDGVTWVEDTPGGGATFFVEMAG